MVWGFVVSSFFFVVFVLRLPVVEPGVGAQFEDLVVRDRDVGVCVCV
jgi:hypothetical protein